MKKPKFPEPRLIREDFLPEDNVVNNYRVLKTQDKEGMDVYYPQYKFLGLFWLYMDTRAYFRSYESAIYYIKQDIIAKGKPKVEYLEVTQKDIDLSPMEPNPPLLKP